MSNEVDEHFFERVDEHINLSNQQLRTIGSGKVSASMMYAVARFNSWLSACDFGSAKELKSSRKKIIKYFLKQYESVLEENLDDYIENYEKYMTINNENP